MKENLKIAFCTRPTWRKPLGGDGIQMLKTKEHLETLFPNVDITIITNPEELTCKFDIAHIFNYATCKITKSFFDRALELHIKIASSSIFWDYTYASNIVPRLLLKDHYSQKIAYLNAGVTRILGALIQRPVVNSTHFRKQSEWFIKNSDIVLPNSHEEGELLLNWVGRPDLQKKISIVVNGVDKQVTKIIPKQVFLQQYKIPDDYILQVGRIQTLKNQINLIYALRDYPEIPVVFLGRPVEEFYHRKLVALSEKRGNVYFIPEVSHDMIDSFYAHARLHVLLSLRESPGLVTIEALANGCPVVTSTPEFLPVNSYFPNQPYRANPFDISNITQTVLTAYRERVIGTFDLASFSWERAAKQTYAAYLRIFAQDE